jgi:hypothetical protein
MHQTIYIDVDEEITSILDRIRQEKVIEIYLVVPKGAMLINSIINLKLLKKESEGMGKNVTIVAPNDKRSRNIIERSGIRVEEYNEQINKSSLKTSTLNNQVTTENIHQASTKAAEETQQQIKEEADLGSTSFFGNNRNNSTLSREINLSKHQIDEEIGEKETVLKRAIPLTDQSSLAPSKQNFENKESNYFNGSSGGNHNTVVSSKNKHEQSNHFILRYKFLLIGVILLGISLLGGASWFFANYPKLEIVVYPLKKEINKEVKIIAQDEVDDIDVENKIIPGEYLEMSLEKTMEFEATGSKVVDKNASQAEGVVTIYNYFSEKPQPLIKTTRVLSKKDKKLFRLTKSIVVPGMVGEEPGKIEVTVQADKPGKDFNIDADSFTIEGFKSKPEKYKKFKVTSTSSMTGGAKSANAQTKNIVTKNDLDTARKKTIESLDDSAIIEIKKRLNSNQEVIEDSINKEVVSSKSSHLKNSITDKFSYTVVYKVKLIVFNRDDISQIVAKTVPEDLKQDYKLDQNFRIELKRGIIDLDKKSLTIYADVSGMTWFDVDKDQLKQAIAGTTGEITKQALNRDAGVDVAELKPSPTWLNKTPKDLNKIKIKIIRKE